MITMREAKMLSEGVHLVEDPLGILASLDSRISALVRAAASKGRFYVEVVDDFDAHAALAEKYPRRSVVVEGFSVAHSAESLRTYFAEVLVSVGFTVESYDSGDRHALKIMW